MTESPPLPIEIVGRFMEQVPVDIRGLSAALGLKINEVDLPDDVSGKIERNRSGDYVVSVNRRHNATRKRFTIAHEIAHFILHRDRIGDGIIDDALYRDQRLPSSLERQANQYAADILMPWSKVIDDPDFQSGNTRSLAARFGVSQAVAEIRQKELQSFI